MKPKGYKDLKHLPGRRGLPYFGTFFEFYKDAIKLWTRSQKDYGDVYYLEGLNRPTVNLIGTNTNKQILVDEAKNTSNKKAWDIILSDLFPNGLMLMDGEEHKYHRDIMRAAFTKSALQGYMNIMPSIVEKELQLLKHNSEIKFFPFYKMLTLKMASSVLFGFGEGDDLQKVNTAVSDIVRAAGAIPLKVPGSTYYKGIKGRKILQSYFKDQIKRKRSNPGQDLFSKLCIAESEDGNSYSDDEIVDHLIFVLMASHDTTAITLTFLSFFLAKHNNWQDKIREEINGFIKPLNDLSDLRRLSNLDLSIKETLRIHPPLTQVYRMLEKDMEVEGQNLPKDTVVSCTMQMTHIDERIWTDPQTFDPTRFSIDRKEHMKCPHAYAPFGAGPHFCIGHAFADMQIKLVMFHLLKTARLSCHSSYEVEVQQVPLQQPKDDLPLYYELIKENNGPSPAI